MSEIFIEMHFLYEEGVHPFGMFDIIYIYTDYRAALALAGRTQNTSLVTATVPGATIPRNT